MGWTDWTHARVTTGVLNRNEKSPDEFFLVTCSPNPLNVQATFEYSLPATGGVRLYIYNALGQVVRRLMDETQSSGYKRLLWDATNDQGRHLSSGAYLYQLEFGAQRLSGKINLQQ